MLSGGILLLIDSQPRKHSETFNIFGKIFFRDFLIPDSLTVDFVCVLKDLHIKSLLRELICSESCKAVAYKTFKGMKIKNPAKSSHDTVMN